MMSINAHASCNTCVRSSNAFLTNTNKQVLLANKSYRTRPCPKNIICAGGFAVGGSVSHDAIPLLNYIGAAVGVALVARELTKEKADARSDETDNCPKCGGSGFEECLCSRWSDDDCGCNTCHGSGRMTCYGCRGGGKRSPVLLDIRVEGRRSSSESRQQK